MLSIHQGATNFFSLMGMPPLQAIYYSIRLIYQIVIKCFPTLMEAWLAYYPSFSSTDSYSYTPALTNILFDSSHLPDSNGTLADCFRLLAVKLHYL